MLYILDDDKFNAVSTVYKCDFLFENTDKFKYFKNEREIDFRIEDLTLNDIVCFHNSFESEKTLFIQKLLSENENRKTFTVICFSGDSSFYNLVLEDKFIKIHKDRFYNNLKQFVDANYLVDVLLYGNYTHTKELSIIRNRINSMLFHYSENDILPIDELQPRDIKRLCELSETNYRDFLELITGQTIQKFKSALNAITQNS